jgi:hypothetical protein
LKHTWDITLIAKYNPFRLADLDSPMLCHKPTPIREVGVDILDVIDVGYPFGIQLDIKLCGGEQESDPFSP